MKFQHGKRQKIKHSMDEISCKIYFHTTQYHDIDKFLLIRLQKSNYQGRNFIILNLSQHQVLKMKFQHGKRQKIKDFTNEISSKYSFYTIQHHDIGKFLLIRLQKSNYQGQKFIILNFCEYKVLKMKFQHGKRQKIKDSTDEISSKYIFTIQHHDIDKFLLITLQKSNFQGQKFIILNFSK